MISSLMTMTMMSLTAMMFTQKMPMKMSFFLMILSFFFSLSIYFMAGSSWMSMIFMMIMTGGVLILFTLISSTMPNEIMKKSTNLVYLVVATTIVSKTVQGSMSAPKPVQELKTLFYSSKMMFLILIIMMMYFLAFINILSVKKTALRKMESYVTNLLIL